MDGEQALNKAISIIHDAQLTLELEACTITELGMIALFIIDHAQAEQTTT